MIVLYVIYVLLDRGVVPTAAGAATVFVLGGRWDLLEPLAWLTLAGLAAWAVAHLALLWLAERADAPGGGR